MHKQARSFDNKLQDPVIRVTPQLNQRKCFSSSNILVCRSNKVHGCMSEKFTSSNGIIVFNVFFLQICTFSHGEDGGNLLSLQERSCNVSFRLGLAWLGCHISYNLSRVNHHKEQMKHKSIKVTCSLSRVQLKYLFGVLIKNTVYPTNMQLNCLQFSYLYL